MIDTSLHKKRCLAVNTASLDRSRGREKKHKTGNIFMVLVKGILYSYIHTHTFPAGISLNISQ